VGEFLNSGQDSAGIADEQAMKQAGRVASTASVDLTSAPSAIDGVTLVSGDRVLIKNGSTANPGATSIDNGVYVFNGTGSAMTRSPDADEDVEIANGLRVKILEGNQNGGCQFDLIETDVQVGVDVMTFEKFPPPTFSNNTLFVDAVYGDNATAQADNPNRPYQTIGAAETAAGAFDKLSIAPANYPEAFAPTKDLFVDGAGATGLTSINLSSGSLDGRIGQYIYTERSVDVIPVNNSNNQNGDNLIFAYNSGATAMPAAAALSNTNRFTVTPLDGIYNIVNTKQISISDFVDIVGDDVPSFKPLLSLDSISGLDSVYRPGAIIQGPADGTLSLLLGDGTTDFRMKNVSVFTTRTTGTGREAIRFENTASATTENILLDGVHFISNAGTGHTILNFVNSGFNGLINNCASYRNGTLGSSATIIQFNGDSDVDIIESFIGQVSNTGHTHTGRIKRSYLIGTSNNWGGWTMAGVYEDTRTSIIAGQFTGRAVNCTFGTQTFGGTGFINSGLWIGCNFEGTLQGVGTLNGTFMGNCDVSNSVSVSMVNSAVYQDCKISGNHQTNLKSTDAGSNSARYYKCIHDTYPTTTNSNPSVPTGLLSGELVDCIILNNNNIPARTNAKHIRCHFRGSGIVGTDSASFNGCTFDSLGLSKSLAAGLGNFRMRPIERSKLLAGTECTLVFNLNGVNAGVDEGTTNFSDYFQVGDGIDVINVGSEYDGEFTIASVVYTSSNRISVTYVNAAVTVDESTIGTSGTCHNTTRLSGRPEVLSCVFNGDNDDDAYVLSKWMQLNGRNNSFDGALVRDVSADYTAIPRDTHISADSTSGDVDVTLLPEDRQQEITIRKSVAANSVLVKDDSGSTVFTMTASNESVALYSDGTNLLIK